MAPILVAAAALLVALSGLGAAGNEGGGAREVLRHPSPHGDHLTPSSYGIPQERRSSEGFFYKRLTKLGLQIEQLEATIASSVTPSYVDGEGNNAVSNDDTITDEIQKISDYGRLADLYAEKEMKWRSGGGRLALRYYSLAVEGLRTLLSEQEQAEVLSSSLAHLQRINVHWMLHRAALLSHFGEGLRAIDTFKEVLQELTINPMSVYGDPLHVAWDKGEITYNIAQTYLNVEHDYDRAIDAFNLTLRADRCKFNAYPPLIAGLKQISNSNNADSTAGAMALTDWKELKRSLEALSLEAVSFDANADKYVLNRSFCPLNSFVGDGAKKESLFSQAIASEEERVAYLFYAIYEVNDLLGNYRDAFYFLKRCNDVLSKYAPYDSKDTIESTANILETFHDKYWPSQSKYRRGLDSTGVGSQSSVPVFIVGFLRSGSTLLESMLQSHPAVAAIGEDSPLAYELDQLALDVEGMLQSSANAGGNGGWKAFEEAIAARASNVLLKMNELVIANKRPSDVLHIVDKNLYNYRNIGLIHLLFPKAVIIHIQRDPMDTVFGCYKRIFSSASNAWSTDVGALATEYTSYLSVMNHFHSTLSPGVLYSVRYEELISNPRRVLRELLESTLRLPWDERVLAHASAEALRPVHTASALQVRREVYLSSVGNWRDYSIDLLPLRNEMLKAMKAIAPHARAAEMFRVGNWLLDPAYDYTRLLRDLALPNPNPDPPPVDPAAAGNWTVAAHMASLDALVVPLRALDAVYPDSTLDEDVYGVRETDKDWVLARARLLIKKAFHLLGAGRPQDGLRVILDAEAYYHFIQQYPYLTEGDSNVTAILEEDIQLIKGDIYAALYMKHFDENTDRASELNFNKSVESFKRALRLCEVRHDYSAYYKIGKIHAAHFYFSDPSLDDSRAAQSALLKNATRDMLRVLSRRLGEGMLMSEQEAVELFEGVVNGTAKAKTEKVSEKMVALRLQNRQLYWAIAEVAHLAKDYVAANGFFRKAHGNEVDYLKRLPGSKRHNIDSAIASAKSTLVSFHSGFYSFRDIKHAPKIGLMTKRPVFIVGFLGSGTELLDSLLSSHPQVVNVNRGESVIKLYETRLMHRLNDLFVANAKDSLNEKNYLSTLKKLGALVNRKARRVLEIYKYRLDLTSSLHHSNSSSSSSISSLKILDSAWDNYRLIGLVHLLFPRALIINMYRDPLDTLLDSYQRSDLNFSETLFTLDTKGLSSEYVIYLRLAHHFASFIPRDTFVSINYEELLLNPEPLARDIFVRLLGLPFDSEHRDAVLSPVMRRIIRRKVAMIGVWKKYKDTDIVKRLKNDINKAGMPSLMRQNIVPYVTIGKNVYKMNFVMNYNFSYNDFKKNLTHRISQN